MDSGITSRQVSNAEVIANAFKSSSDDLMGTYYGRKVTTGENHAEVGVDLNDPTKFFEPKPWPQTLAAGGGGLSEEALLGHLQEYGARLENEHGGAIAAGNNIAPVLNEVLQSHLQDAEDERDFHRQGVLGYQSPSVSYRLIAYLAATRPSGEPAQLAGVVNSLQ